MNEINLNKKLRVKKLFLIGFMASGKTTIGKRLSSKLNLPFFDSDKEIELALGYPINEYFNIHGESKFRSIEERVIINKLKNIKHEGFIMSLGGGAFLNDNIRLLIQSIGMSIWLNGKIDIIYNRLKKSKNERPLTLTFNTKEKLEKLLEDRKFYYKKADVEVNIINTNKDKMTDIILKKINQHINFKNEKN